jgi:hypothetical protein
MTKHLGSYQVKFIISVVTSLLFFSGFAQAQTVSSEFTFATSTSTTVSATSSGTSTQEAVGTSTATVASLIETLTNAPKQDLTKPEEQPQKNEIQILLEKRPEKELTFFNFFAFWVQSAIELGIPANTIVLILLIPVIAMLVTFMRVIIGLPSLEMLVPIVLSFAFVAVGITAGLIILSAVILASFVSRGMLRRVPIMFFPKRSLSLFLLSIFVFAALTISIKLDIEAIRNLSIFPILILTLLGDLIVTVQLRKTLSDTVIITAVTIGLGLVGYLLATSITVRDLIILWPELILLTIPLNLLLGRYFGLRLMEVFRFRSLESYGSK